MPETVASDKPSLRPYPQISVRGLLQTKDDIARQAIARVPILDEPVTQRILLSKGCDRMQRQDEWNRERENQAAKATELLKEMKTASHS
jgi:hypothetical protein